MEDVSRVLAEFTETGDIWPRRIQIKVDGKPIGCNIVSSEIKSRRRDIIKYDCTIILRGMARYIDLWYYRDYRRWRLYGMR